MVLPGRDYKNLGGVGYIIVPIPIMKSGKLNSDEKLLLSTIINMWRSFTKVRLSDTKLSNVSGLSYETVVSCRDRLYKLNLIRCSDIRASYNGVETCTLIVNADKCNEFFEYELFDAKKVDEIRKVEAVNHTGLSVLTDEYYKKYREDLCRR